jgi:hypothetical protein
LELRALNAERAREIHGRKTTGSASR